MKTRLLVTLLAVLPLFVWSQYVEPGKEIPAIEVVGTGEMEIVPDEIYISFTLKERFEGKNKIDIENQEKELKKRLLKLDIDLKDLQLADASSDFIKIKRKKNEVIASKDYLLKVKTTSQIASVFELLDGIDAFNADIQRVDHSEIEKYKSEVKMIAIKAAKEKATNLLSAIGETIGKPLLIQEREQYEDQPFLRKTMEIANMAMDGGKKEEAPLPEIGFQKIKLKYSVFARFAIK
ncbi:MAG: SIMPL domain-containing protein [Verrucomicrobia bacterium]|nr:SIMPL domain-containing protein [Prolixibacteraceae bacterium]